jgi:hypothetical protein
MFVSFFSFSFLMLLSFFQAQTRKEELRKQPEQIILSEVRQVVQQMQALNQHIDEAVSLSQNVIVNACLWPSCCWHMKKNAMIHVL